MQMQKQLTEDEQKSLLALYSNGFLDFLNAMNILIGIRLSKSYYLSLKSLHLYI